MAADELVSRREQKLAQYSEFLNEGEAYIRFVSKNTLSRELPIAWGCMYVSK